MPVGSRAHFTTFFLRRFVVNRVVSVLASFVRRCLMSAPLVDNNFTTSGGFSPPWQLRRCWPILQFGPHSTSCRRNVRMYNELDETESRNFFITTDLSNCSRNVNFLEFFLKKILEIFPIFFGSTEWYLATLICRITVEPRYNESDITNPYHNLVT